MMREVKTLVRSALGIKNETDFYSQGGEDAIVSNTFVQWLGITKGKYIDIGAYHPFRHSNTYLLYRSGWSGINFDPRPGTKVLFDRHRPRDINVEGGISSEDGNLTYFVIDDDSTMNTFSRDNLEKLGIFDQVKRTIQIPVFSLRTILKEHPEASLTDYINIDAEGFELEVLAGNDFARCNPKVISIEQNGVTTLADVLSSDTAKFLSEHDYVPYAKNILLSSVSTVFYVKKELL